MRKKGKGGRGGGEERRETEGSEANVQLIAQCTDVQYCILYKIAQAKQRQRVQV